MSYLEKKSFSQGSLSKELALLFLRALYSSSSENVSLTNWYPYSSRTDTTSWTGPRLTLSQGQFPNGYLLDWTLPRRRLPWLDIPPYDIFRPYILPTVCFDNSCHETAKKNLWISSSMANKLRKNIKHYYLHENSVCDSKRWKTTKTIQWKELHKNNKLHL